MRRHALVFWSTVKTPVLTQICHSNLKLWTKFERQFRPVKYKFQGKTTLKIRVKYVRLSRHKSTRAMAYLCYEKLDVW